MNVLLYDKHQHLVAKSGVGRALVHQQKALESADVRFTKNPQDEYDIIHINTIFPGAYAMSKWAKKRGKKVVYHAHSTEEDFRNSFTGSNAAAPLFRRWITACYNSGDLVLTPTPYAKSLLEKYPVKQEIVPISNGIDLDFFRPNGERGERFREKHGLGKGDKVVLSAGLYIERKGILDFVALARRMPTYQFVWCGYTDLRTVPKKVGDAVRTTLPNLHFPGYIPREEMLDAYSGSDVFFFPTYEETEGIVLLEALAMKLPVLVRDIPIYAGWLQDEETVYKGRNVAEFQQRLEGIAEGKLPDLTEKGYAIAKERDIRQIGVRMKSLYQGLLQ